MASRNLVLPSLEALHAEMVTEDADEDEVDPLRSHTEDHRAHVGKAISSFLASQMSDMDTETIVDLVKLLTNFHCITSMSQPRFPAQLQLPRTNAETGSASSTTYRELRPLGPMLWPEHWGSCPYSDTELPPESCLLLPSYNDHHTTAVTPSKYGHTAIFGIGVCYNLFWGNKPCKKGSKCPTRHEPLHPYEIKYFASIGEHKFLNKYAESYTNSDQDRGIPRPTEPLPYGPTAKSTYKRPRDLPPVASTVSGQDEVRPMLWRRFKYFYRTFRAHWQLEDKMYDYADTEWSSK